MKRTFLLHTRDGNKVITEAEAIQNAQEQEAAGIEPRYSSRLAPDMPPGWLVWSTWEDGAGVVYKRPENGTYFILTGWQGEFCLN